MAGEPDFAPARPEGRLENAVRRVFVPQRPHRFTTTRRLDPSSGNTYCRKDGTAV